MKIAKVVEEMDGACKNRSNHSINIAALYFQLLSQPALEVLMRTDKKQIKAHLYNNLSIQYSYVHRQFPEMPGECSSRWILTPRSSHIHYHSNKDTSLSFGTSCL